SLGQGASIEESRHLGFDNRQHSLTAFHRRAGAWLNPSKKPCHRRRDHITVTDTRLTFFIDRHDQGATGYRADLDTNRFWPESSYNGGNEAPGNCVGDHLLPTLTPLPVRISSDWRETF